MNLSSVDENSSLLESVIDLLESQDSESPEVILLIGRSGTGKSAMINTIHKVLTVKYYAIAKAGSGKSVTVTMDLKRYVNCGVSPRRVTNQRLKVVVPKLQHIFDCTGLADENSEHLKELLELLLRGYIPLGTSIVELGNRQKEYTADGLKKRYYKPYPSQKVSKIVFMQGCIDAIPRNLIACLNDVLEICDKKTKKRTYQCEVFVLISKYDLVKDPKYFEDPNLHGRSWEKLITLEDLEKVEKTLEEDFNYVGHRKFNRILWVSLTDNDGYDNRDIENTVLTFLERMIEPDVPKEEDITPVFGTLKELQLHIHELGHQTLDMVKQGVHISLPIPLVVFIIIVVVIANFLIL